MCVCVRARRDGKACFLFVDPQVKVKHHRALELRKRQTTRRSVELEVLVVVNDWPADDRPFVPPGWQADVDLQRMERRKHRLSGRDSI